MKLLIILILVPFNLMAQGTSVADTVISIHYKSFGMTGNSFELTLTDTSVSFRNGLITGYGKIDTSAWRNISSLISQLDLKELQKKPAPTGRRLRDAGRYAYLTITTNKQTYRLQEFDEGTPIPELGFLLCKINSIIRQPELAPSAIYGPHCY